MELRRFGNLPLRVSAVGFGTSQLANTDNRYKGVKYIDINIARELISNSIDAGINFFDTSPNYGSAESLLGEARQKYPQKLIIATKAGLHANGNRDFSIPFLQSQINESLKRLKTDRLDIFQLIKPSVENLEDGSLFSFLKHLKKKGIIRYSGIIIGDIKTGYQSIESGEVDCLQVLYNLINQETYELIQEAWKKELGVIVRSPLNSGFLSGAYDYGQTFDPNDARSDFFSGLEFEKRLGLLKKVQKDLDISNKELSAVALKFVISNPYVSVVIPGPSKIDQINLCIKIGAQTNLFDEKELQRIKEVVSIHFHNQNIVMQNIVPPIAHKAGS